MSTAAFISDIHSNLEALEAVLADVRTEEVYCLGDLVGYGASPNEVIDLVRERNVHALMGNHDYAATTGDTGRFNARAGMAAMWTRSQLTEENLGYLRSLPMQRKTSVGGTSLHMTHGSPDDPLWEYVDPRTHSQVFGHYIGKLEVKALALGHTHVPYSWIEKSGVVFNPGSVGQPRDGDWRASFAMVEFSQGEIAVEVQRVEYDVEGAIAKIAHVGLPEELGSRLRVGR